MPATSSTATPAAAASTGDSLTVRRRISPSQIERRARVLAVATELAESGGYDAVAMKDVAERSEVALATIYRWFASKDHVLTEVLLGWMANLGAAIASEPPGDRAAADRVAGVMQRIADEVASRPLLAAAVAQALLSFDDGIWDSEHDFHSAMALWIDAAIGAEPVAERDLVIEVLEHVCFSSLISIARGRDTPQAMGERLSLTARMLLRH